VSRGGLCLLLLAFAAGCTCYDEAAARRRREARDADEEPPRLRHARTSSSVSGAPPALDPKRAPVGVTDTRLIFLVTRDADLYAFNPNIDKLEAYHRVGRMDCKSRGGPMSMAVDRKGSAWVFHDSGQLFKVNVGDASCVPTTYQHPVHRFDLGMGFTAKTPGSSQEQLYVMGNAFGLATIEMPSLEVDVLGPVEDGELTGGPDGKLFVFLPDGRLSEIDRNTRKLTTIHTFRGLSGIDAYAFARYAGRFYLFTATAGGSSVTTEFDPKTRVEEIRDVDLGFRVVGAGQSTLVPPPDSGGPLRGDFPEQ